jgi:hypothetical protein
VSSGNERGEEEWTSENLGEVSSGSDGSFHVGIETWKRPHLRIGAEGFADRVVVPTSGHESADKRQTIELSPQASLSATVLDASGSPLPGVTVELSAPGYELNHSDEDDESFPHEWVDLPDAQWKAETGPDGRCVVSALPPKIQMSVEVRRDGNVLRREPNACKLEPGQNREVEWRIGSGCTLDGLALDQDGKPVANQKILLLKAENSMGYFEPYSDRETTASTLTNGEGRFTFKDVPEGTWVLGPAPGRRSRDSPIEGEPAPLPQEVKVGSEPTLELVLHVYRGLYIRGVVVGPDGGKVPDAFIQAGPDEISWGISGQAGKDGSFALGPLGPGSFTLVANVMEKFAPSEPVRAEVGRTDVVLQLRAGGGMRGIVVDALSGAGCLAELYVNAEQAQRESFPLGMGFGSATKGDGKFEHLGLLPGAYGLAAQTSDGRFGILPSVNVAANATAEGLTIRVSPGGKLRFRREGVGSDLVVTVTSQGVPVDFPEIVKTGSTLEKRAPSGPLVVQVRKDLKDTPKLKMVDLAAGETKEVVLHDDD